MASTLKKTFGLLGVLFIAATLMGCDVPAPEDSADELSQYDVYEDDTSYDTDPGLDENTPMDTVDPCATMLYLEQSKWWCGDRSCILVFVATGDSCTVKCWTNAYGYIWEVPVADVTWTPSMEAADVFYVGSQDGCTLASCPGCSDEE